MGSEVTADPAGDRVEPSAASTSELKPQELLYWTPPPDDAVTPQRPSSLDMELADGVA